jgi:hypothetical protein
MSMSYEADVLVWSREPAALLRRRDFEALDIEHIAETPSLKSTLANPNWLSGVWADAVTKAIAETGMPDGPALGLVFPAERRIYDATMPTGAARKSP